MSPVRVLVVDDSPTMRGLLKSTLGKEKDIEVVATVPDCNAARDAVKTLSPDVITLDVEMPGMDGLEFLRRLMQSRPTPVIMVSGLTAKNEDASIKAMSLGAVDCFVKPKRGGIEGFHELANLVRLAAKARVHRGQHPVRQHVSPQGNYSFRDDVVVAIGSSTGGIEALETVIRDFPENCPPTLITQHMPEGFTRSLAQRLDAKCNATIVEATDGARILPGHIYIAPGGDLHLEIMGRKNRVCRLRSDDKVNGHCPSVDVLFNSVAKYAGASAVGVILTGMGCDGAAGLRLIRDKGGRTIGQDRASSVIYGMPKSAFELGGVEHQLPLSEISTKILEMSSAERLRYSA